MTTTPVALPTDLAPRLRAAVTRLNRRLRSTSLEEVSPGQASALAMIERLGSPALNELAAAEQVRPPSMTRLVDALESDGLVERRVDAVDRRCQRISLTPAGRKALAGIRSRKTAFLESRLSQLSDEDRDAIGRALSILERLAEDE
ncbi:MAG TPA: MarR family transcriptional regulator [Acidimicrobiales bacterium]|jgi:DNA-binding MarR family transcriptional regulator|nr:MarR family transcriptional regulator [Acidimicrobiales bacterium]